LIRFENVSMAYGTNYVLKNIDLHIKEGQLAVLIGPSGCGKTTTLQLINRLISPVGGRIIVNGSDISAADPVQLRRNMGYVIQEIGLFPHMTIRRNIETVPRLLGWSRERQTARTLELLKLVGMDETYLDRYPSGLSGGQQQRIGLLRALAADPPIILMDEPFGALDPITRQSLQDEIMRLQKKLNKTVVFVTHDMDEALKIADVIILMKGGAIVQSAVPKELLRHPANEFVESFIGKRRTGSGTPETIGDVMSSRVICAGPGMSAVEAVDLMRREHVSSLFITDGDRRLLGQVTIADLQDAGLSGDPVLSEFTHTDIPALRLSDSARDAFSLMMHEHIDELPVLDDDGRIAGLVTRRSMVVSLARAVWQGDRRD